MTDSIVHCETCGTFVELTRKENKTLILSCDCPEQRAIKVKRAIPEGWTA